MVLGTLSTPTLRHGSGVFGRMEGRSILESEVMLVTLARALAASRIKDYETGTREIWPRLGVVQAVQHACRGRAPLAAGWGWAGAGLGSGLSAPRNDSLRTTDRIGDGPPP